MAPRLNPRQSPEQNMRGVTNGNCTRMFNVYSNPFIYNSNEINKDGYKSPKWVKRVEKMASKKGEGRAALGIPRNKNSQKYQDWLQIKINKTYSKFI